MNVEIRRLSFACNFLVGMTFVLELGNICGSDVVSGNEPMVHWVLRFVYLEMSFLSSSMQARDGLSPSYSSIVVLCATNLHNRCVF